MPLPPSQKGGCRKHKMVYKPEGGLLKDYLLEGVVEKEIFYQPPGGGGRFFFECGYSFLVWWIT